MCMYLFGFNSLGIYISDKHSLIVLKVYESPCDARGLCDGCQYLGPVLNTHRSTFNPQGSPARQGPLLSPSQEEETAAQGY